jgi:rare lipoprotein A
MKKSLTIGLTSSLLATSFGATLFLFGTLEGSIASNPDSTRLSLSTNGEERRQLARTTTPEMPRASAIATIHPYRWQGKLAVILRVRDIPVLTFLGSPQELTAANESIAQTNNNDDPVLRAKSVAKRLNQLAQDPEFDADQITAHWDQSLQLYVIRVGTETLTPIDRTTILPDSTQNSGIDTLQATNRLRRLMGNAAPLQQVTGAPSQPMASARRNLRSAVRAIKRGIASWYGPGFHGRRTANGERYNQHGLTAAHKTLPFGTRVRVTNLHNGQSVVVRINDRGPFIRGRVIDLSAGAARTIGVSGVAPVQLEVLGR